MIKLDSNKGLCTIRVESEMTIYEAQEMNKTLKKSIDTCKQIELNLEGVSELDTAGVQILLMAKRAAEKCGKPFNITSHSEAVVQTFDLLNIAHEFGDPIVISKP